MTGYFIVPRDLAEALETLTGNDHKLFYYLLRRAAFKDTPLCVKGSLFQGLRSLAQLMGCSTMAIRRGLIRLQMRSLIVTKRSQRYHAITISNYDRFVNADHEVITKRSQDDHEAITPRSRSDHSKKEVKKLRSEINKQTPLSTSALVFDALAEFGKVWERYPRPKGRKAAFKHFQASVRTPEDLAAINRALDNYLTELKNSGTSLEYTKHGATWFNNWRDELTISKPRISAPKEILPAQPKPWNNVPAEADLVPLGDIQNLLASLGNGKRIPVNVNDGEGGNHAA